MAGNPMSGLPCSWRTVPPGQKAAPPRTELVRTLPVNPTIRVLMTILLTSSVGLEESSTSGIGAIVGAEPLSWSLALPQEVRQAAAIITARASGAKSTLADVFMLDS